MSDLRQKPAGEHFLGRPVGIDLTDDVFSTCRHPAGLFQYNAQRNQTHQTGGVHKDPKHRCFIEPTNLMDGLVDGNLNG